MSIRSYVFYFLIYDPNKIRFWTNFRENPFRVDVTNVWGHMNLYAKGAGQAVAQLDLTYGIDYEPFKVQYNLDLAKMIYILMSRQNPESHFWVDFLPQDQPPRDCFNLTIDEFFHGRNKSEITIKSCFRYILDFQLYPLLNVFIKSIFVLSSWTLTGESNTSGEAMLIIDIPTGYWIEQPVCVSSRFCLLWNVRTGDFKTHFRLPMP